MPRGTPGGTGGTPGQWPARAASPHAPTAWVRARAGKGGPPRGRPHGRRVRRRQYGGGQGGERCMGARRTGSLGGGRRGCRRVRGPATPRAAPPATGCPPTPGWARSSAPAQGVRGLGGEGGGAPLVVLCLVVVAGLQGVCISCNRAVSSIVSRGRKYKQSK